MAEPTDDTDPTEEKAAPEKKANDDADDVLLFALASSLVPIFFRKRR